MHGACRPGEEHLKGKRILLIEDSRDIQVFVGTVARMEEAEVVAVTSGEEGLELLARDRNFDLVVLDLNLPGLSGWDVISQIEAMKSPNGTGRPPIVIFTALADRQTLEQSARVGATLIIKPISAVDLRARLREAMSG
jgi:CheY-like chemotaxis protein